jgi:putative glutamine amidotransferase
VRIRKKSEAPVIGITPDVVTRDTSANLKDANLFLSQRYNRAVLIAGGIPMVLPMIVPRRILKKALDRLDGILVTGGNFDINPILYGEKPLAPLREIKKQRTQFELELISLALERDLPILGVCGGQQAINVVLGGSLYQDIATQVPHALGHEQTTPKVKSSHSINILPRTKLHRIVGCKVLKVNTTHHQAVKNPGRGLITNATAEDGIIEGIESQNHSFVLGVQWHPEILMEGDLPQRKIFSSFISACR